MTLFELQAWLGHASPETAGTTPSLGNCIRRAREPRISGSWRPEIRVELRTLWGFRRGEWIK